MLPQNPMKKRTRTVPTTRQRWWFPLALAVVFALLGACRVDGARSSLPASGLPHSSAQVTILDNHHFTIGYSIAMENPLWVEYRASALPHHPLPARPRFRADKRVPGSPGPRAIGAGYDRGHMAPNYIMAILYGRKAQLDTFLMTNITPQRPRLNQLLWQRIEEIEADDMAPRWEPMWVVTGPVFGVHPRHLDSGIAIPIAFYRIWLRHGDDGQPHMLALRVPQAVRGDERLTRFLTSVDALEAATSINFFPAIPAALQRKAEAAIADPQAWGLAALACQPARYRQHWQGRDGIYLNFDRCDNSR